MPPDHRYIMLTFQFSHQRSCGEFSNALILNTCSMALQNGIHMWNFNCVHRLDHARKRNAVIEFVLIFLFADSGES